jgi:hypothetical protein
MEQEVNPHERLIVETIIRSIFTCTTDLCRFMEQLFTLIPDLADQVQTMKDSGMTEDEIVQKIMAGVKEK